MIAPQAIGQNWVAVRVILKLAVVAVWGLQFLQRPSNTGAGNGQFLWPRFQPFLAWVEAYSTIKCNTAILRSIMRDTSPLFKLSLAWHFALAQTGYASVKL